MSLLVTTTPTDSAHPPASDRARLGRFALTAVTLALLGGCASLNTKPLPGADPAPPAADKTAAAKPPEAAASKPADPAAPKPFAEVIKDAKQQDGLFPIWRKDEKAWLEIPKSALNKPFLFTVNIANSIGERGLYASQMNTDAMAEWRRVGNQLQLLALNTKFRAEGGARLAVEQAFSPSLLASAPLASAEHPQRKSILVDASFLLSDIPGYSTQIEQAFRLPYTLDKANSYIDASRADASLSTLTARVHFSTPRMPAPPQTPPPVPAPKPPQAVPDARSFFVNYVYSFAALPEQPMRARLSDPRLGHFMESFTDLGSDLKANPRVHYVQRWRLEKKDPAALVSEPVKPIVYWLDKNIPPKYRAAVTAGVTAWSKAFERIGFMNAIVARQQPDDADWDNMDAAHASIRWFVGADVGFAIGPSHTDPRSGEILDADIGMSDVFARGSRRFIVEDVGQSSEQRLAQLSQGWRQGQRASYCSYAHEAAAEMNFALDVLEARGDIAPDSPEAEAFVQSVITDTIMHEVGHTLGLKHNFKASTTITQAQLQDKRFTETHGISGSVMDYNAYNIALQGERQGNYNSTTLGAYDYWAIEYAYKPLDAATESAELAKIAARSNEPALAYADDADAGGFGANEGLDPLANRFDLGDDPLAYYKKRLKLSKELWARLQDRKPQVGDDPLRQRRVLMAGFSQLQRAAELVGKYVGGMHALRDLPGSSARASFTPVEPGKQREALRFLASGLFSADSFRFRPAFLSSLSVDYNEWERDGPVNLRAAVLRSQAAAMDRLLAGGTAQRLLDLPNYVQPAQRKTMISLSEVYATLQSSVWSELKTGAEVDVLRRNLQREHLKRLQVLLTKGSATLPADALSLARLHATRLQGDLRGAVAKGGRSIETRAHLAESLGTLTEALRAPMQRS
ncbi:zinc-dependent metalloprotease [Rhodoferax sp.]|uniref:zinc-dependent metalloprotease n=1 Tax=Rhodoferax sp. TaxID=50421 RepID=UPI002771AA83|nr:zinc-dependent metalloprotease [Rhodoferax sp.]